MSAIGRGYQQSSATTTARCRLIRCRVKLAQYTAAAESYKTLFFIVIVTDTGQLFSDFLRTLTKADRKRKFGSGEGF